ncbi:MAG: type VI secretion system tube protein TssD [Bacteroidales bacterium]
MSVYLKVDGFTEREVLKVDYALHQESDVEGRPSAITRGGKIDVMVKSLNDGNSEFFEWVCDPYTTKDGTIEFEKRDGTNMKTLKFTDAYLVDYRESYDSIDENLQHEIFTISAKKIDIGGVYHENHWAD